MSTADIHNLPVAEKLKLVMQLWDEIATSQPPLTIPKDILAEASRRSAEIKADPSICIDDDELWRQVDGQNAPLPSATVHAHID